MRPAVPNHDHVQFRHADAHDAGSIAALHIAHPHQRQGLGTRLMALTAQAVIERRPSSGHYLWVLEQNVRARRFYEARGGRRVDRDHVHPPGGDPSRICGVVTKLRYVWPDPSRLLITGGGREGQRQARR